jgi:hypothetical protein
MDEERRVEEHGEKGQRAEVRTIYRVNTHRSNSRNMSVTVIQVSATKVDQNQDQKRKSSPVK